MAVQRLFLNWLSKDPAAARDFYVQVLGFRPAFESDWFIQLNAPGQSGLELGLLRRDGETIPGAEREAPRGAMLTIVVPDADEVLARAREYGAEIVEEPRNLFYGQRRLLLKDPDGALVDVSSECDPDPSWAARVRPDADGVYREAGD